MQFYPLEKLINLHDGYRRTFKIDKFNLLLLQVNGKAYLVDRLCPHAGNALDQGSVTENAIQCPAHQFTFDLVTGQCLSHGEEAGCKSLKAYDLAYEGNTVGVLL